MRTRWSHYLLLASTQNLFPSSRGIRTIASWLSLMRRDIPANASINQNIPECLPTQFSWRLNFREHNCNAEWIFANYSAQQFRFSASGNSKASLFFCKIELHNQILGPFFIMAPTLRYLMIHRLVFIIPGWGLVELCLKTHSVEDCFSSTDCYSLSLYGLEEKNLFQYQQIAVTSLDKVWQTSSLEDALP